MLYIVMKKCYIAFGRKCLLSTSRSVIVHLYPSKNYLFSSFLTSRGKCVLGVALRCGAVVRIEYDVDDCWCICYFVANVPKFFLSVDFYSLFFYFFCWLLLKFSC